MQRVFTFLFCFVLFVIPHLGLAQQQLDGKVLDSLHQAPLEGANIRLFNLKDSLLASTVANSKGGFSLEMKAGASSLQVNFVGYKEQKLAITKELLQKPLLIVLAFNTTNLGEIEISAPEPLVKVMGDTTQFSASAYTTEPYADADALIVQLPGVEVDEEGNVLVQGEQVQRIIVDGKEFFSSDPRIALKTLPADVIDKIQIIDEKSEESRFTGFDDGNRKKIINIVTKPNRRHGHFGRATAAYGNQERYNTGGNINFFSGPRRLSVMGVANNVNQRNFSMAEIGAQEEKRGSRNRSGGGGPGNALTNNLAVNYNNEWWEKLKVNANYTINGRNSQVSRLVNREMLIGANANRFTQRQSESNSENNSHRANFKLEYEIDSNQSLTFTPNFSIQKTNNINSSNNETQLKTEEPINASQRNNENRNQNFNFSGSFNYRLKLGKVGRTISLGVNGSMNSNKSLAQTLSFNQFFEDYILDRIDTVNNESNNYGDGNGITGRVAYTEPLTPKSRLQANYSLRNTHNYANRETFEFLAETGQFSELNRQLSNEFQNDYLYHSGGISYQINNEPLIFDFGVDVQRAQLQNQRFFPDEDHVAIDFNSYLPKINLTYRFSKHENVRIDYHTATRAPSINQLQDVINNQNPLHIRTGNAHLKQEYQHRFRGNYRRVNPETGANFSISTVLDLSSNKIVNSTIIAVTDTLLAPEVVLGKGAEFTRPENIDGYYTARATVTFGVPITSLKLNVNTNTGIHHNHDIGLLNNQVSFSNTYGINQRLSVNSRISQKLLFSVSYSGNYSVVHNNTNEEASYNYYNQTLRNDFTCIFWKGVRINSSINYNYNTGRDNGYEQSFVIWNASVGKKLLKKEEAEIALSVYDLLNKSVNVSRTVNERYIEDEQSNMLNQYFILSITYNLRKFSGGGKRNSRTQL